MWIYNKQKTPQNKHPTRLDIFEEKNKIAEIIETVRFNIETVNQQPQQQRVPQQQPQQQTTQQQRQQAAKPSRKRLPPPQHHFSLIFVCLMEKSKSDLNNALLTICFTMYYLLSLLKTERVVFISLTAKLDQQQLQQQASTLSNLPSHSTAMSSLTSHPSSLAASSMALSSSGLQQSAGGGLHHSQMGLSSHAPSHQSRQVLTELLILYLVIKNLSQILYNPSLNLFEHPMTGVSQPGVARP